MTMTLYDGHIGKVLTLSDNESIFIFCQDKQEQRVVAKIISDRLLEYPLEKQLLIRVSKVFKDKKLWVTLTKRSPSHEEVFIKGRSASGDWEIKRSTISVDSERTHIIKSMIADKYSREEIESIMGKLSQIEDALFF